MAQPRVLNCRVDVPLVTWVLFPGLSEVALCKLSPIKVYVYTAQLTQAIGTCV